MLTNQKEMPAVLSVGSILHDSGVYLKDVPDEVVQFMERGGKLDCDGPLDYVYDEEGLSLTLRTAPPELKMLRGQPLLLEEPMTRSMGGAAYTSSFGAMRYGRTSAPYSGVGDDDDRSEWVKAVLAKQGISDAFLVHKNIPTGVSLVIRASVNHAIKSIRGQRLIISYRGASRLDVQDIDANLFAGAAPGLVMLSNLANFDATSTVLDRLMPTGISFMYLIGRGDIHAMNGGALLPDELFRGRQFAGASLNADEWAMLEGHAQQMLMNTLGCISISDGAKPSTFWSRDGGTFQFPAEEPPAPVVDTTGAGDTLAFTEAFAEVFWGFSHREATKIGAMMAARTVCYRDSTSGFLSLPDEGAARAFLEGRIKETDAR